MNIEVRILRSAIAVAILIAALTLHPLTLHAKSYTTPQNYSLQMSDRDGIDVSIQFGRYQGLDDDWAPIADTLTAGYIQMDNYNFDLPFIITYRFGEYMTWTNEPNLGTQIQVGKDLIIAPMKISIGSFDVGIKKFHFLNKFRMSYGAGLSYSWGSFYLFTPGGLKDNASAPGAWAEGYIGYLVDKIPIGLTARYRTIPMTVFGKDYNVGGTEIMLDIVFKTF